MKARVNPHRPEVLCYIAFDWITGGGRFGAGVRFVVRGGHRADGGDGDHLAIVTMTADEAEETAELLRQFADLARNSGRAAP